MVISLICMQDVSDVLTAIDYVIDMGLADRAKISVLGGSHGGFLTTHLIGQVQYSCKDYYLDCFFCPCNPAWGTAICNIMTYEHYAT